MNTLPRQPAQAPAAPKRPAWRRSTVRLLVYGLCTLAGTARAADGCQVLLCLAAPSWRSIPQCVPPVRQVLHDLARGNPFPSCNMAGAGNSAAHAWASPPGHCPPQYTQVFDGESGQVYTCDYDGEISVTVNGEHFTQTWWAMGGDTVTEFSPTAKAQLGTWDTRFDDDYAAWLATLPLPTTQTGSGD